MKLALIWIGVWTYVQICCVGSLGLFASSPMPRPSLNGGK